MLRRLSLLSLLLAFTLVLAVPAQAAVALVVSTSAASPDTLAITTPSVNTTGATLLVMVVSYYEGSGEPGKSDSKSNTWVKAVEAGVGSANSAVVMFYVKNPTVGSGHTFTAGNSVGFSTIHVLAFSGTDTAANVDQTNSANRQTAPITTGSVTPSANGEVLVTGVSSETSLATLSVDSGFTITSQYPSVSGQHYGGGAAYLLQGAAAAVNPTWSSDLVDSMTAVIATFKAASSTKPVKHIIIQ